MPIRRPGQLTEQDWFPHVRAVVGGIPGIKLWQQEGGLFVHFNSGKPLTIDVPKGAADLTGIVGPPLLHEPLAGVRLEVEVKGSTPHRNEEVLVAQQAWAKMIVEMGGIYTLVGHEYRLSMEENYELARGTVLGAIARHAERKSQWVAKRRGGSSSG